MEDIKVLEKVVTIMPKVDDSTKQLRGLRDRETYTEIVERLKKRGVQILP